MPNLNFDALAVNIDKTPIGSQFTVETAPTLVYLENTDITAEKKVAHLIDLIKNNSKLHTLKGLIGSWLYTASLEPNLPGDDKFERAMLASKLDDGGTQEYCKDEVNLMKKMVDMYASVAVTFQFRNYLTEAAKPVEKPIEKPVEAPQSCATEDTVQ